MRSSWLVAAVIIAVYTVLVGCHLNTPFVDDETWEFYASETLLIEGRALTVEGEQNVFHPHGYYYLVASAFALFGINEVSARLVGVLFTIFTFLTLLAIARRATPGDTPLRPGLVALIGIFHLFAPVVVQGSLIITADTAVHHFALALFLWTALRVHPPRDEPHRLRDLLGLALLFAVGLWIKIVSPVLVVAALTIYIGFARSLREAIRVGYLVGVGGMTLFFASWLGYCEYFGDSSLTALDYLVGTAESRAQVPSVAAKGVWLVRQLSVIVLWLGLPFLALFATAVFRWRSLRARWQPGTSLLLAAVLVVGGVYSFIAGSSYGFPRYHVVLMPFAALIVAMTVYPLLRARPISWKVGAGVVAAAALYRIGVGDPVHAATFDLKATFLGWSELSTRSLLSIGTTIMLAALPVGLILVASLLARRRMATIALVTCLAIGTTIGQHSLQLHADHHVHLSYGEVGTRALHQHIHSRLEPERTVIASKDIVHHTAGHGFMPDWHWEERTILLRRLRDRRTQFMVLGLHHNTLAQLTRTREDEDFRSILTREYTFERIGSYFVWERKPKYGLRPIDRY